MYPLFVIAQTSTGGMQGQLSIIANGFQHKRLFWLLRTMSLSQSLIRNLLHQLAYYLHCTSTAYILCKTCMMLMTYWWKIWNNEKDIAVNNDKIMSKHHWSGRFPCIRDNHKLMALNNAIQGFLSTSFNPYQLKDKMDVSNAAVAIPTFINHVHVYGCAAIYLNPPYSAHAGWWISYICIFK